MMSSNKKRFDIERIVRNAELLSIPEVYENYLYECEDPDGFHEVEEEIEELVGMLPKDLSILDLPKIICGNKRTKVYGKAICSAANGHSIINSSLSACVVFQSEDDAIRLGYRPCAKCMQKEYAKWNAHKR